MARQETTPSDQEFIAALKGLPVEVERLTPGDIFTVRVTGTREQLTAVTASARACGLHVEAFRLHVDVSGFDEPLRPRTPLFRLAADICHRSLTRT